LEEEVVVVVVEGAGGDTLRATLYGGGAGAYGVQAQFRDVEVSIDQDLGHVKGK